MAAMWILERATPGLVRPEQLNFLSVLGAMIVIGGSMLCALGAARSPAAASSASTAPTERAVIPND
jgi:hypothetical protein